MVGLGTIINTAAVLAGGLCGTLFGKFLTEGHQELLRKGCGVCTLFIGISGALEKMLTVENGVVSANGGMLLIVCIALGAAIGQTLNIEGQIERFGGWLKDRTGSSGDSRFVEGFVTASMTVCIGAMTIVGSIEDGLYGDYSILATKSVLDFISVMVMTCSLGKGCMFSAVPVVVLQGGFTLLARVIKPLMTEGALTNISLVGSVLIFCVGLNLLWERKIKAANLLPALVIAVIAAFFA